MTGDAAGAAGVDRAVGWFLGDNDAGIALYDPPTGGGYDGLDAERSQREPGRRVDAGPDLDAAAGPASASCGRRSTASRRGLGRSARQRLRPDPRRVLARLFVPGQECCDRRRVPRPAGVVDRVLALRRRRGRRRRWPRSLAAFAGRHRDLPAILDEHFELVAHRIDARPTLSTARRPLLGAYFTQEYAVEAAALLQPLDRAAPRPEPASGRATRAS